MGLVGMETNAQQTLTLEECLKQALQHNRSLQNAALDIQAAEKGRKEAYTHYYPQISANVLAFRLFDELVKAEGTLPEEIAMLGPQFVPMVGMPYAISEGNRGYSASLSIVQPLYSGGRIINGNRLARIGEDVAMLQRELQQQDIKQKVTENYWKLANVRYNLNTIEAAEQQVNEVEKQVELFVRTGVTTRNALLQVHLRKQELASQRLKIENAERILRLLLAQQIGISSKEKQAGIPDFTLPADSEVPSPQSVYVSSGQAVGNREELMLAGKGVEAGQLQVRMERGKHLPSVALGLVGYHSGMGGLSQQAKSRIPTTQTNGLLMGTVSIPISSWWGGNHALKQQEIKLQQSRNALTNTHEQLIIDIESAWSHLQEAYQQIQIAEASVAEASENLRMIQDQYRMGTCSLTDLLDAETLNRQAQNTRATAKSDYHIRLSEYIQKTR